MDKDYITIYNISKELYKEDIENNKTVMDNFDDYYGGVLKKLRQILNGIGVDCECLKEKCNGRESYRIASNQKNNLKELIKSYKNKDILAVRKGEFGEISIEELKNIINKIRKILRDSLDEKEYYNQLNRICFITEIGIDEEMEDLKKEGIDEIIKNIEELKNINFEMNINGIDKCALIKYYKKLIKKTSLKFKEVVKEVDAIRADEMDKINMREASNKNYVEEDSSREDLLNQMMDIEEVISKAEERI